MKERSGADLVVFGKVWTSEDNQIAEAFAVRDGRYVYVGDRAGAEALIEEGATEVIDHTDKGLVMPSCGNGHAHYFMAHAMNAVGTIVGRDCDAQTFLTKILPEAVEKSRKAGIDSVFGFGWTFYKNMPTRQELDAVCADIPIYFADEEGHKGIVNTLALIRAGIMDEEGNVLRREVRGGEIQMGADGTPTGFLSEQAGTYVRSFLDNDNLFSVECARGTVKMIEEQMLREGYTMYMDGWSTYFFNDHFYQAASQLDEARDMHFVLGLGYEIESWMDAEATLAKADEARRYASAHVLPRWVKLFMDGTVESGTGFVDPLYPDGHQGLVNWTEEETADITRKTNAMGMTMHVHTMGNKAVRRTVSGYVDGGTDEMRNTIVHVRNIDDADLQRMADHGIYATSGMIWHHHRAGMGELFDAIVPSGQGNGYPMRSYLDHGINASFHSDFPALSGSPDDPFGIMGIAVTSMMDFEQDEPWWTEECVTREQALTAMTINCARQMFLEDERGSIRVGKFADFLLVDKDVLTCPADQIGSARPDATYFEGKRVYSK